MPINEIRDTLQTDITTNAAGFGYATRKINIKDGYRNGILSIDVFNDNGGMWLKNVGMEPFLSNVGYQLFVSPYPMLRTSEPWGLNAGLSSFAQSGQMAGEPNVLYKEIGITDLSDNQDKHQDQTWVSCFPNDSVSAMPTNAWYSPHLYITLMVWNVPQSTVNAKFSLFIRVEQKKVGMAESSMGQYAEFLDSQIKKLQDTAVVYDPSTIEGYTFPMWKYGGIRPELMIDGTTALRYYNRVASNANQAMVSQDALLTAFRSATTMVGFDEAFGDAAANLPEWITLMNVEGVTAGPIRPYPPPLKYADNGNTLMF
jgi:hypothetical protein